MSETFFNQIIAELKEIRALLEQFRLERGY